MPTATPRTDKAACVVSAGLERSLTEVARAILRLAVPGGALPEGASLDRAGYWLLVRISGQAPIRLSELADSVELDLSTVSRQMANLVASGLVVKVPDPEDGRASLLSLSDRGWTILEAVSEARRQALAAAMTDWTEGERTALAAGLGRLEAGLHRVNGSHTGGSHTGGSHMGERP
ncbi:MAG: MarR family winged helix-turn-helix transcriptional regulator [Acidimicrobiales bacterium]